MWTAAPHPDARGVSWSPRAGGCPRGWWHAGAAGRGVTGAGGGGVPRGRRPAPAPSASRPAPRRPGGGGGHSSHSSPRPSPPLQSNLRRAEVPPSGERRLAGAASCCGVTGCGRSRACVTSLPPSGLWAGETLALGVGMKEGRKWGRGRDEGGKALAGRDGEPALAACPRSARPTAA